MSFDHTNQLWQPQPQMTYDNMENFLPPLNLLPPLDSITVQVWDDGGHELKEQQEQWSSHGGVYYDGRGYGQQK